MRTRLEARKRDPFRSERASLHAEAGLTGGASTAPVAQTQFIGSGAAGEDRSRTEHTHEHRAGDDRRADGDPADPDATKSTDSRHHHGDLGGRGDAHHLAHQAGSGSAACRRHRVVLDDDDVVTDVDVAIDDDAVFDKVIEINVEQLEPSISWGTNPSQIIFISDEIPDSNDYSNEADKEAAERALEYMDLSPGQKISEIKLDRVFIGSCTNGRIEDLRNAAAVVKGHKVDKNIEAMVVPGSTLVKKQAESEGLDVIFKNAGFDWREAGCSMCLGMNPDILAPGERCASTSNRNYEGRQGVGGRTHLVSPEMAVAAAIHGHFVDVRKLNYEKT